MPQWKAKMKRVFVGVLSCWAITGSWQAFSQQTISGTVTDQSTGEQLFGVHIGVVEIPGTGIVTNEYGFYSLSLPSGNYRLSVQYEGYQIDTLYFSAGSDTLYNVSLVVTNVTKNLEEVVVKAPEKQVSGLGSPIGVLQPDMPTLNKIPVLFGERDVIKSLQLMPGVKTGGDGSSGFSVRGGSPDQNLILLDEATVYNPSHLLGFFSTFNSDALKDVSLYKGTQPANYGGRLASALDVRMKEGNKQQLEINGSLGLISSKISVEGPIVKDKASFFVSGRRTYADMFLGFTPKYAGTQLYFYDVNAKVNYRFGSKDVVYLSGYFGHDKLGLEDLFGLNWGNATGTLRWNHIVSEKWFSNTSVVYSNYRYESAVQRGGSDVVMTSSIRDISLKQEFQYFPNTSHKLRFGLQTVHHNLLPGAVSGESVKEEALPANYSLESAVFVTDDWTISSKWKITMGLRISSFIAFGPQDEYTYAESGAVTDTTHYASSQIVKAYVIPEPRLTVSYQLNEKHVLRGAYTRNAQYLHLLSNSNGGSPSDRWISVGTQLKPGISDQLSVGYVPDIGKRFSLETEVYYKYMQHQVDYKDGADVFLNTDITSQLLAGKGRAYGWEIMWRKRSGKLTGWISCTLSRTENQIEGINSGKWFPTRQDKTFDVSVVLNYAVNAHVQLAANWVFNTGGAVTFPSGKYYLEGQPVWLYTERNGYRMPAYHRLDLGATWVLKARTHWQHELTFGVYNAYGRENAYMVDFRQSETDPSVTEIVQTSLFRFVPSVTWNFKWK